MKRILDQIGECLGESIISNLKQDNRKKAIFECLHTINMQDFTLQEWSITRGYLFNEANVFTSYEEVWGWIHQEEL